MNGVPCSIDFNEGHHRPSLEMASAARSMPKRAVSTGDTPCVAFGVHYLCNAEVRFRVFWKRESIVVGLTESFLVGN
jgi:hypothetical protein